MKINQKKSGEVSLQVVIVIVFAVIVLYFALRSVMPKFQAQLYDLGYKNEVQKISNAIDELPFTQGVSSFFSTCMYLDSEPDEYDSSSGVFLKKYIGVVRECRAGSSNCFAQKYKTLTNVDFFPKFEGSCGVLRSSAVFCIKPQIRNEDMVGIIDVNGESGPNILDVDLRTFKIKARQKTFEKSNETSEVETVKF